MKILAIGDFHGKKPVITEKDFDIIILLGDVCDDKKIAPLYKEFFRKLKNEKSLDFEEFVFKKLGSRKKLKEYEKASLKKGRKIMEYLNSFNKPIFMVAGNWDDSYGKTRIKNMNKNDYSYLKAFYDFWLGDKINPKLTKGLKNVRNCMIHLHKFNYVNFVGYGLSSGPENINLKISKRRKRKISLNKKQIKILRKAYRKLVKKLDAAYSERNKSFSTIFITHNIPYKTKLDIVKDKKSYAYKKHLGSIVARNFCLKYKPVLCIGGHIHENPGKCKIGRTLVINPGHKKVFIELDEKKGKIKKIKFVK